MKVKFREGAILEQLTRMKSGTGRMRDSTGLAPGQIQAALQTNSAPKDVADLIVSYVGTGVLLSAPKEKDVEDVRASDIDISLSIKDIMEKIESGEWDAAEVAELESKQPKPRGTLLSQIEALEG